MLHICQKLTHLSATLTAQGIIKFSGKRLYDALASTYKFQNTTACGSDDYYPAGSFKLYILSTSEFEGGVYADSFAFTLSDLSGQLSCADNMQLIELFFSQDLSSPETSEFCIENTSDCIPKSNCTLYSGQFPEMISNDDTERRKQLASEILFSDEGFMNSLLDLYSEDEIHMLLKNLEKDAIKIAETLNCIQDEETAVIILQAYITANPDSLKNSVLKKR